MNRSCLVRLVTLIVVSCCGLTGCGEAARTYPLNSELAQSSVEEAMQAWVDGAKPADLQPEIIVGDTEWQSGKKLTSFEILADQATSDGSNLHIRVRRKFLGERETPESTVKYIVSTSPVITIFPQ